MERSDRRGVRALFFAYFAYVGVFSPFLSLWLSARGLSIVEIALVLSLPQWLRILAPPFWGWLSDRSGRRVVWLQLSSLVALGMALLFPLAQGIAGISAVLLGLNLMTAAQGPIGEALALRQSGGDAGRYGRIRLWGSVGFMLTALVAGPVLDRLGVEALPWLMATGLAMVLLVTLCLRDPPELARPKAVASSSIARRLREPATVAFLVSAFLMVFAHAALYSFWSLFLADHGYSRSAIGSIWAVGVVAEIALFALQRHLFDRFSAMTLLAFSFAVCAIRFVLVGVTGGQLVWVVLTQLMHAVTFGVHHSASMAVMHRWFDPSQQARAQAAFIVVSYGLGGGLGGLCAGWLWEHVAPAAAFLGAGAAAALGWVAVVWSARLDDESRQQPHNV